MRIEDYKFLHQGPRINVSDLNSFETDIGGELDRDLRKLLLSANGGVATPPLRSSIEEFECAIPTFFTLGGAGKGIRRVFAELDAERGGSSPLLVPFAIDVCDRLLCVQAGLEQSHVYIVEFEERGQISEYQAYRTDVSFGELLASLEPDAEQPDYIEQLAQRPWKEVAALIVRGGDINAVSATGLTLLCEAIRAENDGLVSYLLSNGANLQGAMEVAAQNCDIAAIRKLLSAGANPNDGLEFAVGIRRKEIRDLLSGSNWTDST